MFSAFHYNANRGDKRFRQMYKSGEKRPDWNRELTFEDSISRARNNRHLLVEKFRQIQSQLTEENEDQHSSRSHDESSEDTFATKDKFLSPNKDEFSSSKKESPNFKELSFASSSRATSSSKPIVAGQSSSGSSRSKPRSSVSAFDSNSCEGFDYSSSYKNNLGDNFTFNMENYNCSTEDIFDKNFSIDNAARERLRSEVWNSETNDFDFKFDDNDSLLCPGCKLDYMELKGSSLLCNNCALQIDLSSSASIKMIKFKLKEKIDLHRKTCKERIKYKFKDDNLQLYIGCKHCNKEFYIS